MAQFWQTPLYSETVLLCKLVMTTYSSSMYKLVKSKSISWHIDVNLNDECNVGIPYVYANTGIIPPRGLKYQWKKKEIQSVYIYKERKKKVIIELTLQNSGFLPSFPEQSYADRGSKFSLDVARLQQLIFSTKCKEVSKK